MDETAAEFEQHIILYHLQVRNLFVIGVARYDLELARHRGYRLPSLADTLVDLIERNDADILREIDDCSMGTRMMSAHAYRSLLTKQLLYIDQLDLADVNWTRVASAFPNHPRRLDLRVDTTDESFDAYLRRKDGASEESAPRLTAAQIQYRERFCSPF